MRHSMLFAGLGVILVATSAVPSDASSAPGTQEAAGPGRHTFRLSASSHPGRLWDLSTDVHDVWTFHTRAAQHARSAADPPLRPPTDLAGTLRPGPTGFRLAFHSTPHSARVSEASFEVSTNDGRTWRHARVTRTSRLTFHVGFRTPAARGGARYLSLRVTARDAKGNRVVETALHACRLR